MPLNKEHDTKLFFSFLHHLNHPLPSFSFTVHFNFISLLFNFIHFRWNCLSYRFRFLFFFQWLIYTFVIFHKRRYTSQLDWYRYSGPYTHLGQVKKIALFNTSEFYIMFKLWSLPTEIGSNTVVGALTHCALPHFVWDLKVALMKVQRTLIRKAGSARPINVDSEVLFLANLPCCTWRE